MAKGITYGKKFRTKAGKLGRYVYKNGKRVGFSTLKFAGRNAKYGAGKYIANRTYRKLTKKYK